MAKKSGAADATSALFSGKAKPKAKKTTSKGKERETVSFPPNLVEAANVAAAFRQIKSDLEKKGKLADKKAQSFMLRWWCERFAATGKRPDMTHFVGGDAGMDFVVTRKITINAEKQEALEMIGADISDHVETSGINVEMDAIVSLGYMDSLQTAIQEMVGDKKTCPQCKTESPEGAHFCRECGNDLEEVEASGGDPSHVSKIFTPKVTVKEGIIEALPSIAEECEADGGLADKIQAIVEILKPVPQVKKAAVEGVDAEGAFKIVNDSKLSGGGKK